LLHRARFRTVSKACLQGACHFRNSPIAVYAAFSGVKICEGTRRGGLEVVLQRGSREWSVTEGRQRSVWPCRRRQAARCRRGQKQTAGSIQAGQRRERRLDGAVIYPRALLQNPELTDKGDQVFRRAFDDGLALFSGRERGRAGDAVR